LDIQRERSARLVAEFKRSLGDYVCRICGFDFGRFYGALGPGIG
jgi:predicted HNH restriction endonuclease